MQRIINHLRPFAVAVFALATLSAGTLSAYAAPATTASVKCDKTTLAEAHKQAIAAVGYLNYLDQSYNSNALTKALSDEKNVRDNTKNCKHLKKAFNNAYQANTNFYNFYYNVVPANAHNPYTEAALQHTNNAYNLVEEVYGTAK